MSKTISEFSGKAGNIYIEEVDDDDDRPYQVWFEDFCIIGKGDTELEALNDAVAHVGDISRLVSEAIVERLNHDDVDSTDR